MWVLVAISLGFGVKVTPMGNFDTKQQCEEVRERFKDSSSYKFICSKEKS